MAKEWTAADLVPGLSSSTQDELLRALNNGTAGDDIKHLLTEEAQAESKPKRATKSKD